PVGDTGHPRHGQRSGGDLQLLALTAESLVGSGRVDWPAARCGSAHEVYVTGLVWCLALAVATSPPNACEPQSPSDPREWLGSPGIAHLWAELVGHQSGV